jgi:HAD superfamily phosphatase (TIGR01668 family)
MGLKAALIDLDNTLLAWGTEQLEQEVVDWVKGALAVGFKICLLSNTRSYRVAEFGLQLGVPYVGVALKPSRRAARGAMKLLRCTTEETVIIGDQIFTDILMGRRLGLYTILVKPMAMTEQFWMKLVRRLERLFWPKA